MATMTNFWSFVVYPSEIDFHPSNLTRIIEEEEEDDIHATVTNSTLFFRWLENWMEFASFRTKNLRRAISIIGKVNAVTVISSEGGAKLGRISIYKCNTFPRYCKNSRLLERALHFEDYFLPVRKCFDEEEEKKRNIRIFFFLILQLKRLFFFFSRLLKILKKFQNTYRSLQFEFSHETCSDCLVFITFFFEKGN